MVWVFAAHGDYRAFVGQSMKKFGYTVVYEMS
jgi:hypothetical protein